MRLSYAKFRIFTPRLFKKKKKKKKFNVLRFVLFVQGLSEAIIRYN